MGVSGALALPGPAAAQSAGICDRTLEVQDEIVRMLNDRSHCSEVIASDLTDFTELNLAGVTSLKPGDFAGLNNLVELNLSSSALTTLPATVFRGLSKLKILYLSSNRSLKTLPATIFQGLGNLETLHLGNTPLRTLPANLFKGLVKLTGRVTDRNNIYSYHTSPDWYLDLGLERAGSGSLTARSPVAFRVTVLQGAPKPVSVNWEATAQSGLVNGGPSATGTVNIGTGNTQSGTFAITGTRAGGKAPKILVKITSPKFRDSVDGRGAFYYSSSPTVLLDFSANTVLSRTGVSITIGNAEPVEEGKVAEFPVRLSQAASSDVTVDWTIAHGSGSQAADSDDFAADSGTLTITAGDLSGTIEVQTAEDLTPEAYETFAVTLAAPTVGLPAGVALAGASATGIIQNDDAEISISDGSGREGGSVSLPLTISHPLEPTRFRVKIEHVTTSDDDFSNRWGAGYKSAHYHPNTPRVDVYTAFDDDNAEGDETFTAELTAPKDGFPRGSAITFSKTRSKATGTILNAIPARWSIADGVGDEGGVVIFKVTLSRAIDRGLQLSWRAEVDTASGGNALSSDYFTRSSGGLTIPAGQTEGTIKVHTRQDRLSEPVETFFVTVWDTQASRAALMVRSRAVGTIRNDDAAIRIGDGEAKEGDAITFTVRLDQPVSKDVTLRWTTVDDPGAKAATTSPPAPATGATAGTDYTAQSAGSLTIRAGRSTGTITVATIEDSDDEADETFRVVLRAPVGGFPAGLNLRLADAEAIGTIRNDDASSISIADVRGERGRQLHVHRVPGGAVGIGRGDRVERAGRHGGGAGRLPVEPERHLHHRYRRRYGHVHGAHHGGSGGRGGRDAACGHRGADGAALAAPVAGGRRRGARHDRGRRHGDGIDRGRECERGRRRRL